MIWIFNNLSRETVAKLKIDELDLLIELQEEFERTKNESVSDNITFLNQNLKKINVNHLFNNDFHEILETYKRYEIKSL